MTDKAHDSKEQSGTWCLRPGCERTDKHSHAEPASLSSNVLILLEQARKAVLHGTPEQRYNMAAILTDRMAQIRAAADEIERLRQRIWECDRLREFAQGVYETLHCGADLSVYLESLAPAMRELLSGASTGHETTARSERLRLIALELSRIAGTFDIELSTKLGAMAAQILSLGDHLALGERITAVEPLPEQGA